MKTTDNELIYLYKTENLYWAKQILISRYKEKLINVTKFYIKTTFPTIDLSIDEIKSLVYLSIDKTIKKFNLNQKRFNYSQALYTINHSLIAHYCWKLISKGNKILDSNYSLDQGICENNGNLSYLIDDKQPVEEKTIYDISTECFKNFVLYKTKNQNQRILQQIIKYKLSGYKNQEIAKKMNLPICKVVNIYHYFIVNAKKCFSNSESILKIFDKCSHCKW